MRNARVMGLVAVLAALVVSTASAQGVAVRPPVGGGAIDAARKNVAKTNEQTQQAEKAGAEMNKKAAPTVQQKTAPATQQKTAPATQQKAPQKSAPATQQKAGSKAGTRADTGTGTVAQAGSRRNQVQIFREQFSYAEGGRRDPFVSLMATGELRPVFSDLVLTGVLHDTDARKSLAMLIDISTGESYRVRVGQPLGRMRVSRIGLEDVVFTFDEFGLSRTETLVIDKTRKGAVAAPRRP